MTEPNPPALPPTTAPGPSSAKERAAALIPPGTKRRKVARAALAAFRESRTAGSELAEFRRRGQVSFTVPFSYNSWLRAVRPSATELEQLALSAGAAASYGLTIVVLPGPGSSTATMESIVAQIRPAEQVHDVSASSGDGWSEFADVLGDAADDHFVLALRAGDRLEPDAVLRIMDRADAQPGARIVSWDDDVWTASKPQDPLFRPMTFSPELLLSANPYGRSIALRADAARDCGGLAAPYGDDSVWDLVLRMNLDARHAVHVPHVLSHLVHRAAAVGPAGVEVVQAHLDRQGLEATALVRNGAVQLKWHPTARPKVSLLVPTRHNEPLIGPLLDSLRRTDYPSWELVIVDNGGRSDANEKFYVDRAGGLDHTIIWWDEPFNYGAVNNAAASVATGEIVVLLNDDTVIHSAEWLSELVGWLSVPGVGTVGVQMIDPDGCIQHGGVIIGAAGLADHRFQGLKPHTETILGSTDWYRNSVANTGACVALTTELWNDIGGLDERFVLCGSDVVLGLEAGSRGLRNVCTPAIHIDHLESATRKTDVPTSDVFASYWRYAHYLKAGDPFHNPNVSLIRRSPSLRAPDEPSALERVGPALGRRFGGVFKQSASEQEAARLADECRLTDVTVAGISELHDQNQGAIDVRTVNWFVPSFDNPFYGGLATIFRIANHLRVHHGVLNRFVVHADSNEPWFRSGLAAVFPGLEESEVVFCPSLEPAAVAQIPPADVSIATQWDTAYQVAHFPHTLRKFYLVQDFEPMFNPAGTLYALAEETYKMGLLALCNTPHLLDVMTERYQGRGVAFTPAVDSSVFHANGRRERGDEPLNVFVYARPGHWRNCWELVEPALQAVKQRFGREVRLVTAGAWPSSSGLADGMDHLGLLDYEATGDLYRTCDVGVSLTVSEHPSYLPIELMACGVPVVAFDLPAGYWILHHDENALLARRTSDSLEEQISRLISDADLRERLQAGALVTIASAHSSWDSNLAGVFDALSGPIGHLQRDDHAG